MAKHDHKLTFHRFGPVNGQVQKHREGNTAPARRGYWAFPTWVPYKRSDHMYYAFHNMTQRYPKVARKEYREALYDQGLEPPEYDTQGWEKKMMTTDTTPYFKWSKIKLASDTEIWTHLPPKGVVDDREWYQCSVREYQKRVKTLIHQGLVGYEIESLTEVFIED